MTGTHRTGLRVKDLMTAPVAVADPGTRVRDALELLRRHQIRHLPVVSDGRLEGFLSENDIRETLGFQADDWQVRERLDWAVFRVMNEDAPRVDPELSVADAIQVFLTTKTSAVPVVEQASGELVGILSTIDILKAAKARF